MTRGVADNSPVLTPYVARLVVAWLRDTPGVTYRSINGTAVFADISGFTNLTEKLARRGKVGAEEMGDVLNMIFEQLLAAAYEYGAGLVKWGGDAVLLLFDGDRHAEMASRAACEMQRVIGRQWARVEKLVDTAAQADQQVAHAKQRGIAARGAAGRARAAWGKAERAFDEAGQVDAAVARIRAALTRVRPDGQRNDRAWAQAQITAALGALGGEA